ncbi:hypothetical protein [Streptomyces specialis]|uniref:hypothetical protein n=1 Tax=Streptomyces specialis TaxID=498367 RepID=UPI000A52F84B|nr:hypothetical protein [Streptomyces specialis]
MPPEKKKLTMNVGSNSRPSAPYCAVPKVGDQEASRHHVIPYPRLGEFWNTLILQSHYNAEITPLTEAIKKNLDCYGTKFSDLQRRDLGALLDKLPTYQHDPSGDPPGTGSAWDDFQEIYCWLPGNLFVGPPDALRSNPPGKGDIEPKACEAIISVERYDKLRSTDLNMRDYISAPTQARAHTIITVFKETLAGAFATVTPYNADQWKKVNGKYEIRPLTRNIEPLPPAAKKLKVRGYVDLEIEI